MCEVTNHVAMTAPSAALGAFVFWLAVYLATHFYNSTTSPMKDMGKPERFAMELISSSAAAISIMFVLGCIDVAFKSWMI